MKTFIIKGGLDPIKLSKKIIEIFKIDYSFNIQEIYNEYADMTLNYMNNEWENCYKLAKEYYEKNKNLLVPINYEMNNVKLGVWLSIQRSRKNENTTNRLSCKQIELLNDINMIWNIYDYKWYENYELAKEYYEKNKHLYIPIHFVVNNIKIGKWLQHQRTNYRNNTLPKERIALLNDISMIWDIDKENNIFSEKNKKEEKLWKEHYLLAKKYYNDFGNLLVPVRYKTKDDFNLGLWIYTQRQNYKKQKLSKEKIDLLNEIKMEWMIDKQSIDYKKNRKNTKNDLTWGYKYDLAKQYFLENGNLLIPYYYEIDNVKLGDWINQQRQNYRNGQLSKNRILSLEKIGMVWNVKKK